MFSIKEVKRGLKELFETLVRCWRAFHSSGRKQVRVLRAAEGRVRKSPVQASSQGRRRWILSRVRS